jgi:tRNA(fMet)-specific endonuclease VapC
VIRYLLDTNAVITLIANRSPLLQRIEATEPGLVGISSIVVHELYFGAYKSQRVAFNLETLRLLFADFVVVELDREDARAAGEIRAEMAKLGTPIGPYDVLIAGQAKARGWTLVTNNVGEFSRVVGLQVQDWTKQL